MEALASELHPGLVKRLGAAEHAAQHGELVVLIGIVDGHLGRRHRVGRERDRRGAGEQRLDIGEAKSFPARFASRFLVTRKVAPAARIAGAGPSSRLPRPECRVTTMSSAMPKLSVIEVPLSASCKGSSPDGALAPVRVDRPWGRHRTSCPGSGRRSPGAVLAVSRRRLRFKSGLQTGSDADGLGQVYFRRTARFSPLRRERSHRRARPAPSWS